MPHLILIDEEALQNCVESNIYQSSQFDTGQNLANALMGTRFTSPISARLTHTWMKDVLYLLLSKKETGYLLISSDVFTAYPTISAASWNSDDVLQIFQRICRFALKTWNGLTYAPTEKWITSADCGVIFPFPFSRQTGFRVIIRRGYNDPRYTKRHGTRHLFAFAAGVDLEAHPTEENERQFKRAFEQLTQARTQLKDVIQESAKAPSDTGYHPLILTEAPPSAIKFQSFSHWMDRLTAHQKAFVTAQTDKPQRVEGPAGTGKTLCLILRAHYLCQEAASSGREMRILFIAHSEATRNGIEMVFDSLGAPFYHRNSRTDTLQTIELSTLQAWCGSLLGTREVSNAQYLDQDALQAKEMRREIISDILNKRLSSDKGSLNYLSPQCRSFFEEESSEYISELLQHEIGVLIKGRAGENLETYLDLPVLSYCLPASTKNDRRFVFSLYKSYQKELNDFGAFDTDDIVLSSLGRLETPIWRRRKASEGYDSVIIDETHLFNFNELSVFHHLLRNDKSFIAFSIDRSQAPGERGITTRLVKEVLTNSPDGERETKTQVVFRSAPLIVRLAEAITSCGATLFTTFENPLVNVSSVITASDEALTHKPIYWSCANDAEMCSVAKKRYAMIKRELKCLPSDILIVGTTKELISAFEAELNKTGEKYFQILHRGDLETVRKGAKEGALIVSHPDFVGGLEFKAVIIMGVDEGRIPPSENIQRPESRHFVEFKACNRLYVAVTRARLLVDLLYSRERGPSPILQNAITTQAIEERTSDSLAR